MSISRLNSTLEKIWLNDKFENVENSITLEYEDLPVMEALTCFMCKKPFSSPAVRLHCNHVFCKKDIQGFISNGNIICPFCPKKIRQTSYVIDKNIENIMDTLRIYCPYKRLGCTWMDARKKLKIHWKEECQYVPYTCPYENCNFKGLIKDKTKHERDCMWRPYECIWGKKHFQGCQKDKEEHEKTCIYQPVSCKNENCPEKNIPKCELTDHMWHCEYQTKDLNWIIKKSDYLFNLDEEKFKNLKDQCNKNDDIINYLEDSIIKLKERIKFLEKQRDACKESKKTQFYWNPCDKAQQLQLSHNNLVVKHTGDGTWASVRAIKAIPDEVESFYFEVKILKNNESWKYSCSFGICTANSPLTQDIPPGCRNEWCIFNNGSINANHEEMEYDCKMKKNDTVGCYFDTKEGILYFTKNGSYTNISIRNIPTDEPLFPFIGAFKGTELYTNFGKKEFLFDPSSFVSTNNEQDIQILQEDS